MNRTVRHALCRLCLVAALAAGACSAPRQVHRVTDFQYIAKAADAPIDLFVGELTRPYEPIAIVDSKRYESKTDAQKAEMLAELETLARPLGADAVHNVRLLSVRIRGAIADDRVPVPGAWRQGVSYMYFLRGQAVKYVDQVGLPPTRMARQPVTEPSLADAPPAPRRPEVELAPAEGGRPMPIAPRRMEVAEPEEPLRATPRTIREPEVADHE